jgi:putative PEP-CTERM system TPR-repeat lipoprotein
VTLAVGLSLCASVWSQRGTDDYELGLVAYQGGEIRTAYIHLKNAIEQDPLLLSAHLLLGRVLLAMGKGAEAEEQLTIANGLGAHRSLTLIPLAQAYLMQGKSDKLLSQLHPLGDSAEEDAELLALRGQAYLELGKLYDAERSFEQACERSPDSFPAVLGRAQIRRLRGVLDAALGDAQRAVELDANSARAWFAKAGIERDLGNLQPALADFERVVELDPAHLPAQVGRIGILIDLDRIDEAAALIAKVRESWPQDPRSLYLSAIVANRQGDPQTAEQVLQQADRLLSQLPADLVENHPPTLMLAGMVAFSLKQWERASRYLDLYRQRHPDEVGPRKLLGKILLDGNRTEAALALLEPALQLAPDDVGLLSLIADVYMHQGRHLKASEVVARAVRFRPDDLGLRARQAVIAFALGRRAEAIEQLELVFSSDPELATAGASLVNLLMRVRQYDRAVEVAQELVVRQAENATYLNLLGAAHFSSGDLDAARDAFREALGIDGRFPPARLNLAKLERKEGKTEEARALLEVLLDEQPNHVGAMLELARVFEEQGRNDDALRWAERAFGLRPTATDVAVYWVDLLLKLGEPAKALAAAEAMEFQVPDDARILIALARSYLANGRHATAQVVLQRASSLAGYDARLLLRIARLQTEAGEPEGAVWSLQKAVEGEPDYLPARIRLGEALRGLNRSDKAIAVAESLQRDYPQKPYGHYLRGSIEQGRGDLHAALANYLEALQRKGDSPLLATRVYEARRAVEGDAEALAFLARWVAENPGEAVGRQVLAAGYFRQRRWDEAQSLYEELLANAPDDPILLNNLALIYVREDDPRALEYAKRAHELRPQAPQVRDTLGWVLVRAGYPGDGLKHLRYAQSRAAGDPGIQYHIAVALSDLGRTQEAIAELEKALQVDASFTDREDAEALLERLQSGDAA